MDASASIHPFERRQLGRAPFQVTGCEIKRGPLTVQLKGADGLMHECQVGAPGQPMGVCDYCGTGIAECWHIRSADGKRFVVGCDCVRRTADRSLCTAVSREQSRMRKKAEGERIAAMRARLIEPSVGDVLDKALRDLLAALPSPNRFYPGESALGWAEWMMNNAGHAGKLKVTRYAERAEAGQ